MNITNYLLPCSSITSALKEKTDKSYIDVWDNPEYSKFLFLNEKRKKLLKKYKVPNKPLVLASRKYKGNFWDNFHIWVMPKDIKQKLYERSIILSPIFGMLSTNDLVPSFKEPCNEKLSYYKDDILSYLKERQGFTLSLLSASKTSFLNKELPVIYPEYYVKGQKLKNISKANAYLLRYIIEKNVDTLDDLPRINFLDFKFKDLINKKNVYHLVIEGEGNYKV